MNDFALSRLRFFMGGCRGGGGGGLLTGDEGAWNRFTGERGGKRHFIGEERERERESRGKKRLRRLDRSVV